MTVKELIEHLSTMPPDVPVIYRRCSEYEELNVEEVKLSRPPPAVEDYDEERVSIYLRNKPTILKRGSQYMEYKDYIQDDPKDLTFVTCCCFPGN